MPDRKQMRKRQQVRILAHRSTALRAKIYHWIVRSEAAVAHRSAVAFGKLGGYLLAPGIRFPRPFEKPNEKTHKEKTSQAGNRQITDQPLRPVCLYCENHLNLAFVRAGFKLTAN